MNIWRRWPLVQLVVLLLGGGCASDPVAEEETLDEIELPSEGAADSLGDRRIKLIRIGTLQADPSTNLTFTIEVTDPLFGPLEIRAPLIFIDDANLTERFRTVSAMSVGKGDAGAVEFMPGSWDGRRFHRLETTFGGLLDTLSDDRKELLDIDEDELIRSWSRVGFAPSIAEGQLHLGTYLTDSEADTAWSTSVWKAPKQLALFPVIGHTAALEDLDGTYRVTLSINDGDGFEIARQ